MAAPYLAGHLLTQAPTGSGTTPTQRNTAAGAALLAGWYKHVHEEASNVFNLGTQSGSPTLASRLVALGTWASHYRNGSYVMQGTGTGSTGEAWDLETNAPLAIATYWPDQWDGNGVTSSGGSRLAGSAALTAGATSVIVSKATRKPAGMAGTWPFQPSTAGTAVHSASTASVVSFIRIDNELMRVNAVADTGTTVTLTVTRGLWGTAATTHVLNQRVYSPVYIGSSAASGVDTSLSGSPSLNDPTKPLRYGIKIWRPDGYQWIAGRILAQWGSTLQGYDTVWMDVSSSLQYNNGSWDGSPVTPWDDPNILPITNAQWAAYQITKTDGIKAVAGLTGARFTGNSMGNNVPDNDTLLAYYDGSAMENWLRHLGLALMDDVGTAEWTGVMGQLSRIVANDWAAMFWVRWDRSTASLPAGGAAQYLRYAYASFLLLYRTALTKFQFGGPWGLDAPDQLMFLQLGAPKVTAPANVAATAVAGKANLYRRDFANGIVLVNAGGTPITYAPGGTWNDASSGTPSTTSASSFTVQPADALFLTPAGAALSASFTTSSTPTPPIQGTTITANASASSGATGYRMDWGDGTVQPSSTTYQTSPTFTHAYASGSSYTATLTVTNGTSTATAQRTISVAGTYGPTASLSVSPQSGTTPLVVTADLSASTAGTNPISGYAFSTNGGTSFGATQTSPTKQLTLSGAGTYTIVGKALDSVGGTSDTDQQTVVVSVAPAVGTVNIGTARLALRAAGIQVTGGAAPAPTSTFTTVRLRDDIAEAALVPVEAATIQITVIAPDGQSSVRNGPTQSILASSTIIIGKDDAGYWEVLLPAQPQLSPANTIYKVTRSGTGTGVVFTDYFILDGTKAEVWLNDVIIPLPVTLPPGTPLEALSDVQASSPAVGQALVWNGTVWAPGTVAASGGGTGAQGPVGPPGPAGTALDATTSSKGVIQLAGDLSGSAGAPTVPGLGTKADVVNGQVPTGQLGSGTASATTFLAGDRTWKATGGGGSTGGAQTKTFAISTPSALWTLAHNLSCYPATVAFDVNGVQLLGTLTYPDPQTATIAFASPVAGTASVTGAPSAITTPPTAAFTVTPTSGVTPLTVSANAASSAAGTNPIASYRMDWGDGTSTGPQSGSAFSHQFTGAATRTLTLTVTDSAGIQATTTRTVTISASSSAPTVTLALSPTSGSTSLAVTATATATAGSGAPLTATPYRFDWNDEATTPPGAAAGPAISGPQASSTATHTYTSAGTRHVTVYVTDTAGNVVQATAVVQVTTAGATLLTGTQTAQYKPGGTPPALYDMRGALFQVTGASAAYPISIGSGTPANTEIWAPEIQCQVDRTVSWNYVKSPAGSSLDGAACLVVVPSGGVVTIDSMISQNTMDSCRPVGQVDKVNAANNTTLQNNKGYIILRNIYSAYSRDDAVENDYCLPGLYYDCLWDGINDGFSCRPSTANAPYVFKTAGDVLTIERCLVWLQPMVHDAAGNYNGSAGNSNKTITINGVQYNASAAQLVKFDNNTPSSSPDLVMRNCTFLVERVSANGPGAMAFPNGIYSGNTICYLGEGGGTPGTYPGNLPTGWTSDSSNKVTADRTAWDTARADWLARHPNVTPAIGP